MKRLIVACVILSGIYSLVGERVSYRSLDGSFTTQRRRADPGSARRTMPLVMVGPGIK
jgi:hypothetical protein